MSSKIWRRFVLLDQSQSQTSVTNFSTWHLLAKTYERLESILLRPDYNLSYMS